MMRQRWFAPDLPLIALFAGSVLLGAIGGASLVKLAFPAAATLLGVWWSARDPARYVRLLLWTVILVPGLRHYIDWHTAFSQTNPIMLAPYTVVLAAAPSVALYVINGRRYAIEFSVLIGLVLFGLVLAMGTGEMKDALLTAMRWLAPLAVGLYLCANAARLDEMRAAALGTFRLALPLIGIYGILQFVDIAPWDAYFMRKAPINSIGFPVPFQVRVFATMNSPGSLAAMLGTGMLLLLPSTRGIRWVGILLAAATLMLTTQRATLGATVLSVAVLALVARDRRLQRSVGKLLLVVAIASVALLSVPGAASKLTGTLDSVATLGHDQSAKERWAQYEKAGPMLDVHRFGLGLDWSANPLYIEEGSRLPLDSGIIDIFLSLGVFGGAAFLLILATLVFQGLRICRNAVVGDAAGEFGAVILGLTQLPFGSEQVAEFGIFLYLSLGLLLARPLFQVINRLTTPADRDSTCVVQQRSRNLRSRNPSPVNQ